MTIHIDATYRDGVIQPDQPLALPNNTPVHVFVVPKPVGRPLTREEILAIRPKSPRFTAEELDALLDKYSVSVGSLPVDFSRADIYSDHD
jgi:predicted DNA-binding antitoxin AbrB/MazE fold protein